MSGDSKFLFHALPVFFIKYCHKLCIQRQMVMTHILYFMLYQSSLLTTVIDFVYNDNGGSMKSCQLSSVRKILEVDRESCCCAFLLRIKII